MQAVLARRVLAISAVIFSLLGVGFIFTFWSAHHDITTGIIRSVLFVAIMSAVHAIGYRLYVEQQFPPDNSLSQGRLISPAFGRPVAIGFAIQAAIFLFSALLLDMGQMLRIWEVGMIGQVAAVGMILIRRPKSPTKTDLEIVQYGIILFMFAGIILAVIAAASGLAR